MVARRETQTLQQILDPHPLWCSPTDSIMKVLQQLCSRDGALGYALVGTPDHLLGLLTEPVLIRAIASTTGIAASAEQVMIPNPPLFRTAKYTNACSLLNSIQAYGVRYLPVVDESDRVIGVASLERIQQACLQQHYYETQTYEAILSNSPEIIERFDLNLRHLFVSAELTRVTGIPTEQFVGKSCRDLNLSEAMVSVWEAAAERVMATGAQQLIEFETTTPRGVRSFEMVISPEYDPSSGALQSLLCVSRDITERKLAEIQRQAAIHFKDSVERSIPVGIAASDFSGQQIYVNETFANMLGWSKEELLGQAPPYVYWPPEEIEAITYAFEEGLSQGRPAQGWELTFMRRNGGRFPVRILDAPLRDGRGELIGMMASVQDISAEEAISSQLRFQAEILDQINDAVIAVDQNLQITYWNSKATDLYGYTAEEALGQPIDQINRHEWIDPEDEQAAWAELETVGVWHGEVIHQDRHGERLCIEASVCTLRDGQGNRVGLLAVNRDITERKTIEAALLQSEEQRRLALELTNTGTWSFEIASGNASWSDTHHQLLGLNPTDTPITYSIWQDRVHPEDWAWVEQALLASLETRSELDLEYRIIHPDGTIRWVLTRGRGVYDRNSNAIHMVGVMMDVTDRKQVEASLQESESRFQNLVANLPGAVFRYVHRLDGSNQVLYMSPGCLSLWEVEVDTVQRNAQILWDMVHPDDLAEMSESVLASAQTLDPWVYAWRIITPSGRQKWLQGAGQPRRQDNGDVIWDAMILDITDRKQAELELQRRLEQNRLLTEITQGIRQSLDLQTIFYTTVNGIGQLVEVDQVTIYHYMPNRKIWKCCAVFNVRPDLPQALGVEISDADNPLAAQLRDGILVRINDTTQFSDGVNRQIAALFPGAWLIVPIQIAGNTWGTISIHQIDRSYEWTEQEIELLTQVVNQLGIAIQQAQLFEQLTSTNSELNYQVEVRNAELHQMVNYERLLHLITDEVRSSLNEVEILAAAVRELTKGLSLGRCVIGLINSEQMSYTVMYECTGSMASTMGENIPIDPFILTELQRGETTYLTTDHSISGWYTLVACPILQEEQLFGLLKLVRPSPQAFLLQEIRLAEQVAKQCAIGIRQARLYQSVQRQVDQLVELNEMKEEFLNLVSHELRTPLTSMKMALTMLEIVGLTESQSRYFNMLKQEWKKELELVNNLLDLQRLESGKRTLELVPIDVQEWIHKLIEPFHLRCLERGLSLITQLPEQPLTLISDLELLSRIFSELLNNAVKYTPSNEIIHLTIRNEPAEIQFQVINTGVEIPSDQLFHVFEKFHRIVQLDRYQQGGTGLGLSLVKKGVELLGGQIQVSSQNNRTCFSIRLPLLDRATVNLLERE